MKYDLEERSYKFAADVREFVGKLGNSISVVEDGKQVIRSSGSVAANYIEANDALSKKDFLYRIKICRKESKESVLFLRLLDVSSNEIYTNKQEELIKEATELMKIFGTILHKSK
ncbi:MAG: four helix bundle protein [Bacteroidales bacterium]|jgi:four helix bundle protein|nr:four helix bundle protein [Bacteroidales bacterium]